MLLRRALILGLSLALLAPARARETASALREQIEGGERGVLGRSADLPSDLERKLQRTKRRSRKRGVPEDDWVQPGTAPMPTDDIDMDDLPAFDPHEDGLDAGAEIRSPRMDRTEEPEDLESMDPHERYIRERTRLKQQLKEIRKRYPDPESKEAKLLVAELRHRMGMLKDARSQGYLPTDTTYSKTEL